MRSFRLFLSLLAVIYVVEPAPQLGTSENGQRSPSPIGALLSQLDDIRNNFRERQGQVVATIFDPLGRLARPRPGHPRPVKPTKNRNGSQGEHEENKGPERDEKPQQNKKGNKERLTTPSKQEEDSNISSSSSTTPKQQSSAPSFPEALSPKSGDLQPSTEDWSNVSPIDLNWTQDRRKIIKAPCLGGLARDGSCKAAFDEEE